MGSQGGYTRFEDIYPKIKGWGLSQHRANKPPKESQNGKSSKAQLYHVGYTSDLAKPCLCGWRPVFEQAVDDVIPDPGRPGHTIRRTPAQHFVAICPVCDLRAEGQGALDQCLESWNKRKFTKDSMLVREKMTDISTKAAVDLCNVCVSASYKEAVDLLKRKKKLEKELRSKYMSKERRRLLMPTINEIEGKLRSLNTFFRESPLMHERDADAVLSAIRKEMYPGEKKEDIERRLNIPLDLTQM